MNSRGDMHFPVVINGLDYLHSSVSSLADEPEGRALKYAVLHLQFAAETLFKARLELHEPALVWANPKKFDDRLHRLGDFKSIGTPGALERLRDDVKIANPIDPQDAALTALVGLRNRLTHFGASDTAVAVEARAIPVLDLLLTFIDDELLPHDDSDTAAEAWELMETIRPLVGRIRGLVDHRLGPLGEKLGSASGHTLRCLSCGHFAALVTGDGVRPVGCLLCGKAYDDIDGVVDAYGVGSFYEAITQGGEPPAYECAECSPGEACVVPVQTAGEPDGRVLVCLWGAHPLEGLCAGCQRAADFALPEASLCSDCVDIRFAKF
ncbi:hypothetical protein OG458_42480 (plasmid) [Streptomyces sp. NBC_01281]|uniref:hypothetical protein n=1 Tax=Streptomyces sp. NBC_01281 TaxID=2903811 RepID=UPI002E153752|nr:hypothetical protein OG458_41325 [Streptomyces sp. NBC_01281]WSK66623.1 hypothetical protein OG458_42480 [Streptomyces sp. NBC_01281]